MVMGHIYKIITGESNECYVGSTFKKIHRRFDKHRNSFKKNMLSCSSKYMFEKYGVDKCRVILIKNYDVVDKHHLKVYESLWIYTFK